MPIHYSRGERPFQRYTGFRTPVRGQFSDGTLTEYRYRYRYEYCLLTLTLTLASFTFSFFSPCPYSFCTSRTLRLDLKRHFSKYSTVISFKLNFGNLHTSSIRVHHYNLSSLIDRGHYWAIIGHPIENNGRQIGTPLLLSAFPRPPGHGTTP